MMSEETEVLLYDPNAKIVINRSGFGNKPELMTARNIGWAYQQLGDRTRQIEKLTEIVQGWVDNDSRVDSDEINELIVELGLNITRPRKIKAHLMFELEVDKVNHDVSAEDALADIEFGTDKAIYYWEITDAEFIDED
jgi:uncharacterized protein (DUF342 family)